MTHEEKEKRAVWICRSCEARTDDMPGSDNFCRFVGFHGTKPIYCPSEIDDPEAEGPEWRIEK